MTIYDVAKRAGTSPSTVGSVMNGSWRKRRISETRANSIKKLAYELGYSVNLQASALRLERSRIIGMIVPMHDNRYFSSISQTFEKEARKRGLFPIISSTLRDPKIEEDAVRLLLGYQVERIVCTGATDPDNIADICRQKGVQTFNLDLPGSKAPSVISNNYQGALSLTIELIKKLDIKRDKESRLLFIGGRPDNNTNERIRGFKDANKRAGLIIKDNQILICGYSPKKAEDTLDNYFKKNGKKPAGILVNSTISLEGVMNWFNTKGTVHLKHLAFGCFDWDPFAAMIQPGIIMVRQNVDKMVSTLFELMDRETIDNDLLIQVSPSLLE
ncbi:MAG: substrate-binding domain-containing protein [Bacteroidota bacterium]